MTSASWQHKTSLLLFPPKRLIRHQSTNKSISVGVIGMSTICQKNPGGSSPISALGNRQRHQTQCKLQKKQELINKPQHLSVLAGENQEVCWPGCTLISKRDFVEAQPSQGKSSGLCSSKNHKSGHTEYGTGGLLAPFPPQGSTGQGWTSPQQPLPCGNRKIMSESLITLLFEMLLYKPILLPQQPEYWPEVSLARGETSMTGQKKDFEKQAETNIKWHLRNGAPTDCLTTPAESLPMNHHWKIPLGGSQTLQSSECKPILPWQSDQPCPSVALRAAVVHRESPQKTGQGLWAREKPHMWAVVPPLENARKVFISQSGKI